MNVVSGNQTRVCLVLPNKVQSFGLWKQLSSNDPKSIGYNWLDFSLPRLELSIAVIFAITQSTHFFFKRFGLPLFTSQLLAGLILSPAVLGKERAEKLMTSESVQVIGSIGAIGLAFFVFLAGVKMDPSSITRMSKRALYVGLLSIVAPLICAAFFLMPLNLDDDEKNKLLFISPSYVSTTFPAISYLLNELKITNSELGRTGLSAAVISDLMTLFFVLCSNFARVAISVSIRSSANDVFFVFVLLVIVFCVLRPAMQLIVRYTPEGKPVHPAFITVITSLFLLSVSITKWQPQFLVLAPYFFGMAVPHGPPLGSALVDKLESMVHNLFLPLFATTSGMRVTTLDIKKFTDYGSLRGSHLLIATVILTVKFVAALLPPLYSQMPTKDCFALACIMSYKGVIELSVFTFLHDQRVLDRDIHSFATLLIFYTASIVPVMVKLLYDPSRKYAGYYKRNIMDSKPHSVLQIVACIHVPDNVRAVLNLLDVSCPTKDNPMDINVVHLVKLRGQSTPIFISHQKKRRPLSTCSYSENVIVSFSKFERQNWGAVSVNTFTAVSPPNLMQDDICTLALDKLANLIILPFHRRWYIDGSLVSDDDGIRILNSRVLEKAPCSVGILIDRGNINSQIRDTSADPSYNIAMIFLGGRDDREALTFAKRMAQDAKVCLTVAHLTASEIHDDFEEWDRVLDSVALRDVKTNGYINYMEKEVKDGPETAMIIRSMVNEYNLIIVGRRDSLESAQTSGLKEWSEFPELGILGDLLASIDFNGRCSVLVVQQQKTS